MSKSVLIIGSEGYIGSRIAYDLQNTYDIHGIDICWFGKSNNYTEVKDYNQLTKEELFDLCQLFLFFQIQKTV